jgi:16S rRNA (cytosine1402-N4)-methyltransferase
VPLQKQKPKTKMSKEESTHIPVLRQEVLNFLTPRAGESYLDVTAGLGGHAAAVLERTKEPELAVLIDRDAQAVELLQKLFPQSTVMHLDYLSASKQLAAENERFDMILADLGVSSPQLDSESRGFSLHYASGLDMRMDTRQVLSAEEIVNTASEEELIRIFEDYGEEPKARRIANDIVRKRPIRTTDQLVDIAARAWPRGSRKNPATRIFQALRIAVNDELGQLEQSLPIWLELLKPGGRIAVISFHSLEDRIVKNFFADHSTGYDAELTLLTKKPVAAISDEIVSNPRARSAKLRAAAKIKTKERIE